MVTADKNGKASGTFVIPEGVMAGTKQVEIRGVDNGGSRGFAQFTGQGTLVTTTLQNVTTTRITHWWQSVDPLAQTFTLGRAAQLAGIDLWFTAVGSDVRVQLRETVGGAPSRTVLADVVVPKAAISTTTHTRVLFDAPVPVQSGEEYAFVVMCDDATTALAIAELGKMDTITQTWVTSQPYTVGTLLSSSNASTWTAHQDKDLSFRILEAAFAPSTREIDMGTVALNAATDLVLAATEETPSAAARIEYDLTLPDKSALRVAAGQITRFAVPVSGNVAVKATLRGTPQNSSVLWPGTQIISGTVAAGGDYFTRSITATDAAKAVLIYDAVVPSGATVTPKIQKDSGEWEALTPDGVINQGDGLAEYRFTCALSGVDLIKAQIALTGTNTARPGVRNIRFMAVID